MSIHTRVEELNAQGYSRNRIKEILKDEFPDYHDNYYDDVTSETEAITTKSKEVKPEPIQKVQVVGFDMPFGDMVVFIVKWTIAAIPAIIILFIIGFIITALLASLGFVF